MKMLGASDKEVFILSNSGKRADLNRKRIEKMGVPGETISRVTDTFLELEVIDPFAPPMQIGDDDGRSARQRKQSHRRRGSSDKRGHHMPDPITKRGKIKRRRGRSRPIDKSQKPGKGITNRRQDRKGGE